MLSELGVSRFHVLQTKPTFVQIDMRSEFNLENKYFAYEKKLPHSVEVARDVWLKVVD